MCKLRNMMVSNANSEMRRQIITLPVELGGTPVEGESQRRKGHLDKVFQMLQLSRPLKDPSGPQKLSRK